MSFASVNPVTKLILIFIAAIYSYFSFSINISIFWMVLASLPLFFLGRPGLGCLFLGLYGLQLIVDYLWLPSIKHSFLVFMVSYLSIGMRVLMPSIAIATYLFLTTQVHEWTAAFQFLRFPTWLLIPFAVMVRFFPTVYQDYRHIRRAMALRGIGVSFWSLFSQPLKSFEFIVIPVLMNAVKVSEDLTVSALTKGMGLNNQRSSYIAITFKAIDYWILALGLVPLILHFGGI